MTIVLIIVGFVSLVVSGLALFTSATPGEVEEATRQAATRTREYFMSYSQRADNNDALKKLHERVYLLELPPAERKARLTAIELEKSNRESRENIDKLIREDLQNLISPPTSWTVRTVQGWQHPGN